MTTNSIPASCWNSTQPLNHAASRALRCFRLNTPPRVGKTAPGLILLFLALLLGPGSAFAQVPSATLLTTFTNPVPAAAKNFGRPVAALGSDRVLIGANGQAYLFSLNGTLLTTFTKPDPAAYLFGIRLAGVGSDRVLISAPDYNTTGAQTGRAYLFSTNGTLITTFPNPNPARVQAFGESLAALGSDRVLIGGHADGNVGAPYLVGPYLFRTNGTLLTSFTSPTPAIPIGFGESVAAVGSDRVLISAANSSIGESQAGVAYLYDTNGTLLTIITNPVPMAGDRFGSTLGAVGSDRLFIGSYEASKMYLFSLSGTLLTTFISPSTAAIPGFGYSVAAVGSTRVLISAFGAPPYGGAYLFSTNGTLLNTITNPAPAVAGLFGEFVAAVGSDRVIIGAGYDATGGLNAGSAYLFDLPYPPLSIARNAATVSVKWVTPETGLALQQAGVLGASTVWSNTSDSVSINSQTNVVQQTLTTTNRFFRLRRP